jgi:hypothetical protein
MCTVPPLRKAPHPSHYSNIIAEVENLERYVVGTVPGKPAPPPLYSAKNPKPIDQPEKHISCNTSVHNSSINFSTRSVDSVVTVGSSIEPDFDVDASVLEDLSDDVHLSA